MFKLDKLENVAKIIASITAIVIAIKLFWKTLVKAYKYLQESDERQVMLSHIVKTLDHRDVVNKAIMDKIGLGYFQTDERGYTTSIGDIICKTLGWGEDDLMGLNWTVKVIHKDRERVMAAFNDSIRYKTDFEESYCIMCGDGKVKRLHAHARQTPLGYFGIITEMK